MGQVSEEYISLRTADMLKAVGFDEPTLFMWYRSPMGDIFVGELVVEQLDIRTTAPINHNAYSLRCSAPTQAFVKAWIAYNYHITIDDFATDFVNDHSKILYGGKVWAGSIELDYSDYESREELLDKMLYDVLKLIQGGRKRIYHAPKIDHTNQSNSEYDNEIYKDL